MNGTANIGELFLELTELDRTIEELRRSETSSLAAGDGNEWALAWSSAWERRRIVCEAIAVDLEQHDPQDATGLALAAVRMRAASLRARARGQHGGDVDLEREAIALERWAETTEKRERLLSRVVALALEELGS